MYVRFLRVVCLVLVGLKESEMRTSERLGLECKLGLNHATLISVFFHAGGGRSCWRDW